MTERWRPIPGWEEYSISSHGRVRSEHRQFVKRDGQRHTVRERILKPARHRSGRRSVLLAHRGTYERFWIHKLVAEAFGEEKEKAA
jgi:hypothetical protein